MKKISAVAVLSLLALLSPAKATLSLDLVTVGNAGNAADTATGLGSVGYEYKIGTYEVTVAQYTVFLNAVAKTDTYGLYSTSMALDQNIAGISRTGSSGSYLYSVIGDSGNLPIAYVNWFDAARFMNWLHNGQPTGAQTAGVTETGAYALNGATTGVSISKSVNALYWLPTQDEWYKAAYYDAGLNTYWLYPTRSNTAPGNDAGAGANLANYISEEDGFDYSATPGDGDYYPNQRYLTNVGAFTGSASYYGTYDQGGNLAEWNDAVFQQDRGLRGGSWDDLGMLMESTSMQADNRQGPTNEDYFTGFRVAGSTIPEPTSAVLFGAGLLALGARRRR